MIVVTFLKSRSKRYKEALKYANFLCDDNNSANDTAHVLNLPLRTIIEKWEWFNLLYWIVLDWKGTTVAYDSIEYYSHTDKTRIFYALQQIHSNWINYTTDKIIKSYNNDFAPKSKLLTKDAYAMSNDEVNRLIDVMTNKTDTQKKYEIFNKNIEQGIKNDEHFDIFFE